MKIWYEWSLFHLLSLFLALHENSCSKCDQNKSTRQNHGKMAITCWEKIRSFDILGQCNVCVLFFILILISHLLTTHIVAARFFSYYSKNNMRIETNVELKTSARSENTKWYDFFCNEIAWICAGSACYVPNDGCSSMYSSVISLATYLWLIALALWVTIQMISPCTR